MSQQSKREWAEVIRDRCLRGGGEEKMQILDESAAAPGFHRNHTIRFLSFMPTLIQDLERHSELTLDEATRRLAL